MTKMQGDFLAAESHNGVTFTRLEHIPHVAVITHVEDSDSLDGLKIWRDREELDLRGLITDYPASPEEIDAIAQGILADSKDENGVYCDDTTYNQESTKYADITFEVHEAENNDDRNKDFFAIDHTLSHMNQSVQNHILRLTETYFNTACATPSSYSEDEMMVQIRVNSDFPHEPHDHITRELDGTVINDEPEDTLTISFSRDGTIIYSDDFKHAYQARAGQVALMDETVWHDVEQYDESWEDEPRTTLLMS